MFPAIRPLSENSKTGTGERLLTGRRLINSRALSMAALSSSHTAEAIPDFAAASDEPSPELGAINSSLSLVIIMKSAEHAIIAALPAHVPAITDICGTTPDITEAALSILPYAANDSADPST